MTKFSGISKEDAHSWLSKFEASSKIDQWQDADKCLIFSNYIDGVCWQWFQSLGNAVKLDWGKLANTFIDRFLVVYGIPERGIQHANWLGGCIGTLGEGV